MSDITIPKKALGAAAHHAAITIYRLVDPDTRAHELTEDELGEVARSSIATAINAWPYNYSITLDYTDWPTPMLVLPLPKEPEA